MIMEYKIFVMHCDDPERTIHINFYSIDCIVERIETAGGRVGVVDVHVNGNFFTIRKPTHIIEDWKEFRDKLTPEHLK